MMLKNCGYKIGSSDSTIINDRFLVSDLKLKSSYHSVTGMLPNINNKSAVPMERFLIKQDSIEDLFYDANSSVDHLSEVKRVQAILNKNIEKLDGIYNYDGTNSMDRASFERFVERSIGIGGPTAGEIFSCSTGLYGKNAEDGESDDTFMTRSEFATGIVRIANLYSLMNDGMCNTSELAKQTSSFLAAL